MKGSILVLFLIATATKIFAQSDQHADHIRFVKLPRHLTAKQVSAADNKLKRALIQHAKRTIAEEKPAASVAQLDLIIQFVDDNGKILSVSPQQNGNQTNTTSLRDANDLHYSFDSPDQPWSAEELTTLSTYANDFYPVIKKILGGPFFDIDVNVRKDTTITYAGLYFPALNEMVLHHPAADVFCHESIHAFRDDFVMTLSTFEEGLTRATEIEVFNQLEAYIHPFDENHSYGYDYYYEALNRPSLAASQGSIYLNPSLQFLRYQIGSYVWAKPFIEDSLFFRRFSDSLYERMLLNPGVPPQETGLRNMFIRCKSTIEGLPAAVWYQKQFLLKTNPALGYSLFQRINEYNINYFNRLGSGYEEPQAGAAISWKLYDYTNTEFDNGSAVSGSTGSVVVATNALSDYSGSLRIVASVQTPQGTLSDTIDRAVFTGGEDGVFGFVEGINSGTISICPLDTNMNVQTAPIVNGVFVFPGLENVRGRFRVSFVYPDCKQVSRIFTKDRSKYFLAVKRDAVCYWAGTTDSLWTNPSNWSSGVVPEECTDVVIPANTIHPCVINVPVICRSLKLESNAVVIAKSNIVVRQ